MDRPSFRETTKGWLEIAQITLTIIAFLAAGWWFYRQGQNRPRLKVEHHISHHRLSKDRQLLVVDVVLTNVGNIPLDLKCGKIRLYELIPERKVLVNSEDACNEGERILEPGEEDHVSEEFDSVGGDVAAVRVYSYFENPAARGIGWDLVTIYDLGSAPKGRR
jgi:hypothetical protein